VFALGDAQGSGVLAVGTVATISAAVREGDAIRVLVEGHARVQILAVSAAPRCAKVAAFRDRYVERAAASAPMESALRALRKLVESDGRLPSQVLASVEALADPSALADRLASYCDATARELQQILELDDPLQRLTRLAALLDAEADAWRSIVDRCAAVASSSAAAIAARGMPTDRVLLDRLNGIELPVRGHALRAMYPQLFAVDAWILDALPSDEALRLWKTLHNARSTTRLTPVAVPTSTLDHFTQVAHERRHGVTVDVAEPRVDVAELFRARAREYAQARGLEDPALAENATQPEAMFSFATRESDLHLLLIEVAAHQLPLYELIDYKNDMPSPGEQAAVLQLWEERFGTVPVYMAADVLELWVERPPQDPEVVRELLVQHVLYCPDLTVAAAASQVRSTVWSFCWD
jgi:hypothetical protein